MMMMMMMTVFMVQFYLRNVTAPKTKFYAVVSSLPAKEIAKFLNAILESQDYTELKRTHMESHERTKPELSECRQQQFQDDLRHICTKCFLYLNVLELARI